MVHIVFQSGAALDKMDYSQNTPMSLALIQEHNDIVKYLIQAGASASLKVIIVLMINDENDLMIIALLFDYWNREKEE